MELHQVKEKFMFIVNEIITSKEKQDAAINKGYYLKGQAEMIAKIGKILNQPPSAKVLEEILNTLEASTIEIVAETKGLESAQEERKKDTIRILSLIENLDKTDLAN